MFPIGRKAARNAQVMQELAPDIKKIKEVVKEALRLGQIESKNEKYKLAEKYYIAAQNFSKLLNRNPEGMLIVQAMGIGGEQYALKEMINLYTVTNDLSKLHKAKTQLSEAEKAKEELKRKARGE